MIDAEKSLAEIERRSAPARWPPRLAMALGVVCCVAAAAVTYGLSAWRADVIAKAATLRTTLAAGSASAAVAAAARRDHHDAEAKVGGWERRRLGLWLAGVVLLLGGFAASGLRRLHEKMRWVVANDAEEPQDPLSSPDRSTDPPPGRSASHPE